MTRPSHSKRVLGPAVLALLLTAGGYVSSRGADVAQPAAAATAITVGFSLVPALLIMLSLVALRGFGRPARTDPATGPAPDHDQEHHPA